MKSVEQENVNRTTVKAIKDAKRRISNGRENRQNPFSATILRTDGGELKIRFYRLV